LKNEKNYPDALVFPHLNQMFDTTELGSQRISSLQRRYLNIAWENKLLLKLETDVLSQLKERAEGGAIQVFCR